MERGRSAGALAPLAATLLLLACGKTASPFAGLTSVSGPTPFVTGCDRAAATGVVKANTEVEPFLATDPTNPAHLVGVWQQDRWSNGGSMGLLTAVSSDTGKTWAQTFAPFSRCTGGTPANGADYERATDPWVTFSPDGTLSQLSASFDSANDADSAILASRSTDNGQTWSAASVLAHDTDPDVFNDKPSITADPGDAQRVYAVWDRVTGQTNRNQALATGPTWFARMTNGTWEPARIIYDPGMDAQTIANQIVVLPDGVLVNLFVLITRNSSVDPVRNIALVRSEDHGTTWSASPIIVAPLNSVTVEDVNSMGIRSGEDVPTFAVNPSSGSIYSVWQDARFSNGTHDGIAISTSVDEGLTWSTPAQINQVPAVPAFGPTVSVTAHGRVGVSYYDLRDDDPKNAALFLATAWLVTSDDSGATWHESRLTGAFDLGQATFGAVYFLGDYQGLAASGESFIPFFSVANTEVANPTEIVVAKPQ